MTFDEYFMILIFGITVFIFIRLCYRTLRNKGSRCGHCQSCDSQACHSSLSRPHKKE